MLSRTLFHPAVGAWFDEHFKVPTPAQAEAWPLIKAGRNVLIAAPTGSGKTLAAFMAAIDELVRQGVDGGLKDETQVVYVSPLKALSNDIHCNLEVPIGGIREKLRQHKQPDIEIRTWVRTGDTPARERQRMIRRPPHIVVTTPESLYILLGSEAGRSRRNPCDRAQQARQPSDALSRTSSLHLQQSTAAHRAFSDAKAPTGCRAIFGRQRR